MGGGNEQWYRMFGRYPSGRKIEGEQGCLATIGWAFLILICFAIPVLLIDYWMHQ